MPALSDNEQRDLLTATLETHNIVKNLQAVADRDLNVLLPKIAEVLAAVKADPTHGAGEGDVDPNAAAETIAKLVAEKLKADAVP